MYKIFQAIYGTQTKSKQILYIYASKKLEIKQQGGTLMKIIVLFV